MNSAVKKETFLQFFNVTCAFAYSCSCPCARLSKLRSLLDASAVEYPWRPSRRLTSHAAVIALMSSFSTQSLNFLTFIFRIFSRNLKSVNGMQDFVNFPPFSNEPTRSQVREYHLRVIFKISRVKCVAIAVG